MDKLLSDPLCSAVVLGATGTALAAWLMARQSIVHRSAPGPSSGGYFALLPIDLQLHILTVWLTDGRDTSMLRMLSRLDVACCAHSLRCDYLALVGHPAILWNGFDHDYTTMWSECNWDTVSFVQWLASRQIRQKHVFLNTITTTATSVCLPHIDSVVIAGQHYTGGSEALQKVMEAFPNLTSLTFGGSETWAAMVPLLPTMPLKRVIYYGRVLFASALFCEFFSHVAIGPLETVRVPTMPLDLMLISLLAKHSHTLQVLEVSCKNLPSAKLLEFVQCCDVLKELVLFDYEGTDSEALAIVHARRSLERFILCGPDSNRDDSNVAVSYNLFADLLEQCGWLSVVHVGNCCYYRTQGKLMLISTMRMELSHAVVNRIADMDIDVKELEFSSDALVEELDADMQAAVGKLIARFGHGITTLTLLHLTDDLVICIRDHCPRLTTMTVCCDDRLIEMLALSIPGLLRLGLFCEQVSDDGFAALLKACPKLEEVKMQYGPDISSRSLDSILQLQHHLRKFTWTDGVGFVNKPFYFWSNKDSDINQFRCSAREQQLLPVAVLGKTELMDTCKYSEQRPANMFT